MQAFDYPFFLWDGYICLRLKSFYALAWVDYDFGSYSNTVYSAPFPLSIAQPSMVCPSVEKLTATLTI